MGRHSAPDDEDGDLLVVERLAAPESDRPRPRPRHAVVDADDESATAAALVRTEVIEPELVERSPEPAPREVVDAEVVEDERRSARPRSGPTPQLTAPVIPTPLAPGPADPITDTAPDAVPVSAGIADLDDLLTAGAATEAPVEAPTQVPIGSPAQSPIGDEVTQPPAPAGTSPKKERASRADLRLLRQSSSLRARCFAAIVLPFIVYTIVLVVISRVDVYVFWIWIPAILAGVLFGAQLDGAVKRDREQAVTDVTTE